MPELKEATKFDQDKNPWDLLPFDALAEVTKVLAIGAKKYGRHNWCSHGGMNYSRLLAAINRHLNEEWWQNGEDYDEESKLRKLGHAACDILFLLAYTIRGIGKDDRPKTTKNDIELMTYEAYLRWCKKANVKPTTKEFWNKMCNEKD